MSTYRGAGLTNVVCGGTIAVCQAGPPGTYHELAVTVGVTITELEACGVITVGVATGPGAIWNCGLETGVGDSIGEATGPLGAVTYCGGA